MILLKEMNGVYPVFCSISVRVDESVGSSSVRSRKGYMTKLHRTESNRVGGVIFLEGSERVQINIKD
jgi:hypothetical protein